MRLKKLAPLSLFMLLLLLAACNNPAAENPARWHLPWTWGDQLLAVSLREGCQGDPRPETVEISGKTYRCSNTTSVETETAPRPTAATPRVEKLECSDDREYAVPSGGQLFKAVAFDDDGMRLTALRDYDVIYDPSQSGVGYLPALGWWYQPCLPATRLAHEVALTLTPGSYKFVGPECSVWLNDGNSPGREGDLLISRENFESIFVPETKKTGESWVLVSCGEGDASGFSFALRGD